jgi:hypothetical protein
MRTPSFLLLLLSVASAVPAAATPLSFGAFNGAGDFSSSPELGGCKRDGEGGSVCALARTSFGGLETNRSIVALNGDGRVRRIEIGLDASDYPLAYQLLVGRYGRPVTGGAAPLWNNFDDKAALSIRVVATEALVTFDFPANARAAGPDTAATVPLLLFLALGLVGGLILSRWRRAPIPGPPSPLPAAEPSMRATLERRIREGGDLTF